MRSDSLSSPSLSAGRPMVGQSTGYVSHAPPDFAGIYDVYVLAEFDHLPIAEIARRLSLSLATVKIRLHRARTKLHEELRRHCRCYYNERGGLMGEPKRT
jgi:RNA polymerase sigma-70 factor (ECF subfamily)